MFATAARLVLPVTVLCFILVVGLYVGMLVYQFRYYKLTDKTPRVCVIVTGGYRTYDYVLPSIESNVLLPLRQNQYDVTLLGAFVCYNIPRHKLSVHYRDTFEINTRRPPESLCRDSRYTCTETLDYDLHKSWSHRYNNWGVPAFQYFIGAYTRYVGAKHVRNYERVHMRSNFEYIVWLRSDHHYPRPMRFAIMPFLQERDVVTSVRMPIFGYDDKQMFGRRDVVLQILDECGLTLSRPYNFSKQGSFIAEEYFAMLLTSLGVTVIETDIITDRCDAKAHIQGLCDMKDVSTIPICMLTEKQISVQSYEYYTDDGKDYCDRYVRDRMYTILTEAKKGAQRP
eukprot:gene6405-7674_t